MNHGSWVKACFATTPVALSKTEAVDWCLCVLVGQTRLRAAPIPTEANPRVFHGVQRRIAQVRSSAVAQDSSTWTTRREHLPAGYHGWKFEERDAVGDHPVYVMLVAVFSFASRIFVSHIRLCCAALSCGTTTHHNVQQPDSVTQT